MVLAGASGVLWPKKNTTGVLTILDEFTSYIHFQHEISKQKKKTHTHTISEKLKNDILTSRKKIHVRVKTKPSGF